MPSKMPRASIAHSDRLVVEGLGELAPGRPVEVLVGGKGSLRAHHGLSEREIAIVHAGGLVRWTREHLTAA